MQIPPAGSQVYLLPGHSEVRERLATEMYARGLSTRCLRMSEVTETLWEECETYEALDMSELPLGTPDAQRAGKVLESMRAEVKAHLMAIVCFGGPRFAIAAEQSAKRVIRDRTGRRRVSPAVLLLLLVGWLASCQTLENTTSADRGGPGAVLAGAGDIASCSGTGDEATSAILDSISGTVFTAGDNAYPDGTSTDFADCYDPSWGRHRDRTRPTPGNHDYNTADAAPYFDYFGASAGRRGQGYYSYDLGDWHIIALNSEISMSAGSPQEQWLRADLAATPMRCTLAYMHRPRFSSSSQHGSQSRTAPVFEALYEAGAEVLVGGHDHTYERFAPQAPDGSADAMGIRQFVVGTGGRSLYDFGTPLPNSLVRYNDSAGVIKFTLYADGYEWEYIPVTDGFSDSGYDACH